MASRSGVVPSGPVYPAGLSVPGAGLALGSPAHSDTTSWPASRRRAISSVIRMTSNAGMRERLEGLMLLRYPPAFGEPKVAAERRDALGTGGQPLAQPRR